MGAESYAHTVGWIGTGRMGYALAERLLDAGVDFTAYNRTRSKAEPLGEKGAAIVDSPAELADRDIVFTMVAGPLDVLEVTIGDEGVLSRSGTVPSVIVDSTTIDPGTSETLRTNASALGTEILAVPVSGNPKVVKSGRLTSVASGPPGALDMVRPYLDLFGRKVTYVGEQDQAWLVKICHNLMLGVVAQSLTEITVLAEAAGVRRAAFLEFLNDSVMGSTFTMYKTPAFVHLDYTPTFTWHLLQKDFDLGLASVRNRNVPLPTAALVHQIIADGIGRGFGDQDFAALLESLAQGAGIEMEREDVSVGDGLS